MDVVRPICDDVAQLGAAAIAAYSLRFDHVVPKSFRVDPRGAAGGGRRPRGGSARCVPDRDRPAPDGEQRRARPGAGRRHSRTWRPGQSAADSGGSGRALRARRSCAPGLQRDHERHPGPGRRSGFDRAGVATATGVRRAAAPERARSVPPARRDGGVRGRRGPGDRHVRVRRPRALSTGGPGQRARQHLRGRRQATAPRQGHHRLRGRADRDRRAGRPDRRPCPRRRRPRLPGRARSAGRRSPGDRLAASWPRRSRPSSPTRSPGPNTPNGSARPSPAGSPRWCWSTTWPRGSTWSTRTRLSTWRSRPRMPPAWPAGSPMPARSSSDRGRRCRWATTAPAAPTCCPRADPPATPRGSTSGPS